MNNIVDFIQEKLRIDKDIQDQDTFVFDFPKFKNEVSLPFKIKLTKQNKTELIYKIEKNKYKNKNKDQYYWFLYNKYYNPVCIFDENTVIKFFKNKLPMMSFINYLGRDKYSKYEVIEFID